MTHLGAREYDPLIGRFVSVDPLMAPSDPQQINGYTYGNNNPITYSDPSGLMPIADNEGYVKAQGKGKNRKIKDHRPKYNTNPTNRSPETVIVKAPAYEIVVTNTGQIYINSYPVPSGGPSGMQLAGIMEDACGSNPYACSQMQDCIELYTCDQIIMDELVTTAIDSVCAYGGCGQRFREAVASDMYTLQMANEGLFEGGVGWGNGGAKSAWAGGGGSYRSQLSACKNSFVGDTPVLMADGSTKPIKDVRIGEKVLATDPETGRTAIREVTAEIIGAGVKRLVRIVIDTEGGGESGSALIIATADHPFWDPTMRRWIDADDLSPGDTLRTAEGSSVTVADVSVQMRSLTVYNLTVAEIHTYYVIADTKSILVHNCGNSIYEAGGKHGPAARNSVRGTNSAEPLNGQGALKNSIEWTPEGPGQAPRRIGVSSGQIVVLDRTRQSACGCRIRGGVNDIWHGHVRSWDQLSPGMQSAVKKAGLVDRKGRPLS